MNLKKKISFSQNIGDVVRSDLKIISTCSGQLRQDKSAKAIWKHYVTDLESSRFEAKK